MLASDEEGVEKGGLGSILVAFLKGSKEDRKRTRRGQPAAVLRVHGRSKNEKRLTGERRREGRKATRWSPSTEER